MRKKGREDHGPTHKNSWHESCNTVNVHNIFGDNFFPCIQICNFLAFLLLLTPHIMFELTTTVNIEKESS